MMIEPAEVLPALDSARAGRAPALPSSGSARAGTIDGARLALGAALGTRLLVWAVSIVTIAIFGVNTAARDLLDPSGVTAPMHSGC